MSLLDSNVLLVQQRRKCWVSVLSCLLLACLYVGSLYVRCDSLPNHQSRIKRRCTSVLLVFGVAPAVIKTWMHVNDVRVSTQDLLQILFMVMRLEGFVPAALFPILLTMVRPATSKCSPFPDVESWLVCVEDAVWLRNQVVALLTEELEFREAMLPMLLPCSGATGAVFTAPLFFCVEQQASPNTCLSVICALACHLVGPVLCHSFCNSQGLSDISSALQHPQLSAFTFLLSGGDPIFPGASPPPDRPILFASIPVCSLAPLPSSICMID
uniref:Farnesylated proteins-converting enzyme 2 n=1 Tax=Oryzias latipes TaxID=8090 RepID=A0A3P9H326_ORYLA